MKNLKRKKQTTKIVVFGGFISAGKSTLIIEIGKRIVKLGKSVVVITNDQGVVLIDDNTAKNSGFKEVKILNGCFCTWFPDFLKGISSLVETYNPDYILVEPDATCSDILATIVIPLMMYYKGKAKIAPLFILIDGTKLANEYAQFNLENPDSHKIALVSHQVRQGQHILVSKHDLVKDIHALNKGYEKIKMINQKADIIAYSIKSCEGIDKILKLIMNENAVYRKPVSLDYNKDKKTLSDFKWFNETCRISHEAGLDTLDICRDIIDGFQASKIEIAHIILFVVSDVCSFKITFINDVIQSEGLCSRGPPPKTAVITLDVGIKMDYNDLIKFTNNLVKEIFNKKKIKMEIYESENI